MNELLLEFLGDKLNLVDPYDVIAYFGIKKAEDLDFRLAKSK